MQYSVELEDFHPFKGQPIGKVLKFPINLGLQYQMHNLTEVKDSEKSQCWTCNHHNHN